MNFLSSGKDTPPRASVKARPCFTRGTLARRAPRSYNPAMKNTRARRCPPPVALTSLCVLLLLPGIASAQVPGSLQTDPLHLRLLTVLSGCALPSSASPWSGAAALRVLEGLPATLPDGSPGVAAEAIESLRRDDVTMVDIRFVTRLEYYLRPPEPLSFADRLEMIDPIGMLEMSYQAGLPLTVFIQATLQREYQLEFLAPAAVSNLPSPLPGNPVALENNDVMAGYLLYAPGPFEIVFGRQRFSLGPSPLTSLREARYQPY